MIRYNWRWCFVLLAVFLFSSCAIDSIPPRVKDGKSYGITTETFRNRWWNYYERGLSFAEGDFYIEAISDLKQAVREREIDQRMARTYGMHFIDYFPHREIGILYYYTNDIESARKELELSLQQFPSDKARFYLDRVRRKLIEREGKIAEPPTLSIENPAIAPLSNSNSEKNKLWTRDDPIIISGVAEDENYVSEIRIKGVPIFMEGSQKRFSFRETLTLSQGQHLIEVTAQNLMGKISEQKIIVHIDRQGPLITIQNIRKENETIIITGSVYDEAGLSGLVIDARPMMLYNDKEIFFKEEISPEKTELEISAQDRLKNETSAQIDLSNIVSCRKSVLVAGNNDALFFSSLFGSEDISPPAIQLKGWTENQTVFMDTAYIEGYVRDTDRIVKLMINNVPALRREGRYIIFGHVLELNVGKNEIRISAEDMSGNKTEKVITIIREVPKALQLEERLSMTILPFSQPIEASDFSNFFQDALIHALVNQKRFRVIERDRIDSILQELAINSTALIDNKTAIKVGRLIAARSVVTGTIIESKTGIEIVCRLIDTETSEILASVDIYSEIKDITEIKNLSQGIAVKLHREFPMVDGVVIEQKDDYILIDLGEDRIRRQKRFIVFRETPVRHPETGTLLGSDNVIIGHARIIQVMPNLSKADIVEKKSAIQRLDKVIAE